jgi:uncharacterized protein YceH (UPF0502 family)
MDEQERHKLEGEKEELRREYQRVLANSVDFEKRIRNRWREKNKQKANRIAQLEARVEELEQRLDESNSKEY